MLHHVRKERKLYRAVPQLVQTMVSKRHRLNPLTLFIFLAIPFFANAASLSGLSCSSGTVTGAGKDTCTVTLAASAFTGGLAVSLSSSDGAVRVPSSVTVPAGASSAHFTATVAAVKAAQTATLTASASGVTKSCALQLKGSGPALTLQSTSISFGEITLNTPSTQAVTLTSSGTAPLTI